MFQFRGLLSWNLEVKEMVVLWVENSSIKHYGFYIEIMG
jgi:hypothetical protein